MPEHNFIYVTIGITSLLVMIVAAKTSILLALLIPASLFLLANQ